MGNEDLLFQTRRVMEEWVAATLAGDATASSTATAPAAVGLFNLGCGSAIINLLPGAIERPLVINAVATTDAIWT